MHSGGIGNDRFYFYFILCSYRYRMVWIGLGGNTMRFIFSAIGFALFIVGCQSMVPVSERTIELPTRQYQQPMEASIQDEGGIDVGVGKRFVQAIREACQDRGTFSIVHNHRREKYICYPEE